MIPASVGFQCPECVTQAARDTPVVRTRFGVRGPAAQYVTTGVLIAINAAIFALVFFTGRGGSPWFFRLALSPIGSCLPAAPAGRYWAGFTAAECANQAGATWYAGVDGGAWWQIMTSAFLHVDPLHIAMNMLALGFLGPAVEQAVGRGRFIALYLVSALGGSVAVFWFSDPASSTLGASGAIFGLMGALLVFVLKSKGNLQQILFWVGLNLVLTFTMPHISWQGHVGGLLAGGAVAALFAYAPKPQRNLWHWAGVAGIAVLLIGLAFARTLTLT